MSNQYDNELRGVLFKNDKKGNDKAPEYKGKCEINGVEYQIAAWVQSPTDPSKAKYMSLKFQLKQADPGAAPAQKGQRHDPPESLQPDPSNDGLPF